MKRQQCHVLYGALLVMTCGLALIAFAKWVLWTDRIVHATGQWYPSVVLLLAIFICALGVLGMVGAMLSSNSLLISYTSFSCLGAGALLFAGRFFLMSVNGVKDGVRDACTSLGLGNAHPTDQGLGLSLLASDRSFRQAFANCRRKGHQKAKTLVDCGQLGQDNYGHWYRDDPNIEWFTWLEAYGCGGFCTANAPLLRQPAKSSLLNGFTCAQALVQELDLRGALYAGLVAGACFPLLLAAAGTCCILCRPPLQPRIFSRQERSDAVGTLLVIRHAGDDSDEEEEYRSEFEMESGVPLQRDFSRDQ